MCDQVALRTSASGAAAEMAMLRYLRLLPAAERAALRHSWVLEQLERLTLTLTLTLILTLTLTLTLTRSSSSLRGATSGPRPRRSGTSSGA